MDTFISTYLGVWMQKDTMGGTLDTLVKELQVTPLFSSPSLDVTTTTTVTHNDIIQWLLHKSIWYQLELGK